jgi:hypothetical protein
MMENDDARVVGEALGLKNQWKEARAAALIVLRERVEALNKELREVCDTIRELNEGYVLDED